MHRTVRANSIANCVVPTLGNAEKKLVISVHSCTNLPSDPVRNQWYICFRIRATFRRKKSSNDIDEAAPLEAEYVFDDPLETRKVEASKNGVAEFSDTFVVRDLVDCPLVRRTACALLDHSLAGIAPRTERKSGDRKYDLLYELEARVYRTAETGGSECIALGYTPFCTLQEGRRHENYMKLERFAGPTAEEGETSEELTRFPDVLHVTLEPVGIGIHVVGRDADDPYTSLLYALREELSDTFSDELVSYIAALLLRRNSSTLTRSDFESTVQELYFLTGAHAPEDNEMRGEGAFLFAVFDKDVHDTIDIGEFCGMLKSSSFCTSIKPRWKNSGASPIVEAAVISGCCWTGLPPPPFEYSGFRRPDGHAYLSTKPPNLRKLESLPEFKEKSAVDTSEFADRNAVEQGMPRLFHEKISKMVVRSMDLAHCELQDCRLVSCKISAGKVSGGFMESCTAASGCEVSRCSAIRGSSLDNCRIRESIIVNSRLRQCEVREVPIMQSSCHDCCFWQGSYSYCHFTSCFVDPPTMRDEHGNLLEKCRSKPNE